VRKYLLFLSLCFLISLSFAQKGATTQGVTLTGIKGITRTVPELLAFEASRPKLNFAYRYKREHEAHLHRNQNPDALSISNYISTPARTHISNSVNTATQSTWSNFLAVRIGDTPGWNPPDNNGDVGITQLGIAVNGRVRFYNKPSVTSTAVTTPTGTSDTEPGGIIFDMDTDAFFTNNAIGVTIGSDLHIRFDRLSQRWFIVQISIDQNKNNYCCIAVSSGAAITNLTSFTFYYFRVGDTGGSINDFFDYPTLGIDNNSLLIGGNMFGPGFTGCNMYVVNKASLITGTLTVTGFAHSTASTDIYTPQGVHNDDPAATQSYFIGTSQTVYSKLVMKRITYSGGIPSISTDISITTQITAAPLNPTNLGGSTLDALDGRLFAAMIKKNKITGASSLWTANTSKMTSAGVGSSSGTRDGAIWYEIGTLTTTPTMLRSASFYDAAGTNPISYINTSIAMSGQGHCIISHTSAGANSYAQCTIAGQYRTDPSTTFQAPVNATTTTSSYTGGRWGDYSQTVVDPTDDMTMWTFQQYAQGLNNWGTRAIQIKAPPPPAIFTLTPAPSCGTNTITINGTSVNNSEFFDPGAGYLNRLGITVSGPSAVTVSNITFVSPTQMTADFSLASGAISGTYTVTITNPDGQTTTATFNLASACPTTFTWTGGTSADWTVGSNWSTGVAPGLTNVVTIPSGTPFSPIVLNGKTGNCKDLIILTGAILTVQPSGALNVSH
jgi:hypothetical protein